MLEDDEKMPFGQNSKLFDVHGNESEDSPSVLAGVATLQKQESFKNCSVAAPSKKLVKTTKDERLHSVATKSRAVNDSHNVVSSNVAMLEHGVQQSKSNMGPQARRYG